MADILHIFLQLINPTENTCLILKGKPCFWEASGREIPWKSGTHGLHTQINKSESSHFPATSNSTIGEPCLGNALPGAGQAGRVGNGAGHLPVTEMVLQPEYLGSGCFHLESS